MNGTILHTAFLFVATGTVSPRWMGEKKMFDSPKAVMKAITERMDVVENAEIKVKLKKKRAIDNNWIENFTAATGEDFVMKGF